MKKTFILLVGILICAATVAAQKELELYAENVSECMGRYEYDFVNKVCLLADELLIDAYGKENDRFQKFMTALVGDKIEDSFFQLPSDHKLLKQIKKGKARKFWIEEAPDPLTEESQTMDWMIAADKNFIYCGKELIEHKGLLVYFIQYERFKEGRGKLRAQGMQPFFKGEDYRLTAVRWFILMEVLVDELLRVN